MLIASISMKMMKNYRSDCTKADASTDLVNDKSFSQHIICFALNHLH